MIERLYQFAGYRYYDIGMKTWEHYALDLIKTYGASVLMGYPTVVKIDDTPIITYGAYTCYAGVASTHQDLFMFHLLEKDAYITLTHALGVEPMGGLVGGIPLRQSRKYLNPFNGKINFIELPTKESSLGGFNILAIPDNREILYASGYFEGIELSG